MEIVNKRSFSITLKVITIFLVIIGVAFQNFTPFLAGRGHVAFLYFTTQSNIIVGIVIFILFIYELKGKEIPPFLSAFHHIAISAILLTFLVFSLFLGPFIPMVSYFYSPSNVLLHNLVPILAIFNYLLAKEELPKPYVRYLALISALTYMIATYILYFSGVSFGKYEFPYFFLNYKESGWLKVDFVNMRFGVIYWWIIICLLLLTISVSLYHFKRESKVNEKLPLKIFIILFSSSIIFSLLNVIIKLSVGVPFHETSIKIFIA
ncbi:MAG: hypothetical protein WC275_03275 [Bacilli bacterium]